MSTRRALITGITGQDGSYLADFLLQLGYEVHGLVRRSPTERFERIEHLRGKIRLHQGDVLDQPVLSAALRAAQPDEVYHLAAATDVAESWRAPVPASDATALGTARMLEAVRETCPDARVLQPSASEMFGRAPVAPQDESAAISPVTPYGAAKAYAHSLAGMYREAHGLWVARAILYNHESPRRGRRFLLRKITLHTAGIRLGAAAQLRLGNLEAERDIGFALDYVRAMWQMLQQEEPGDFVIATGRAVSVRECLAVAFDHAGLPLDEHLVVDPSLLRPAEPSGLVGDASRAAAVLDWRAEVGFEELVRMMVDADYALLRHELGLRGVVR